MTEPALPDANVPQGQEVVTDTTPLEPADTGTQENTTPWAKYLEELPESVRPLVEPTYKQWDADVTKKFQSLHSEYEPYKQIITEWEPDALQQAVAIAQAMEADPATFIQQVIQAYGLESEQGTANSATEQTPDEDLQLTPEETRIKQLEDMVGQLAQAFLGTQEQQTMAQQQAELESTMKGLADKHGEFDEMYVLNLMAQGVDPEKAVQQFKSTIESYASKLNAPQQTAPAVVSANGGYPSQPVTAEDLASNQKTVQLVAQMLASAQEQS